MREPGAVLGIRHLLAGVRARRSLADLLCQNCRARLRGNGNVCSPECELDDAWRQANG